MRDGDALLVRIAAIIAVILGFGFYALAMAHMNIGLIVLTLAGTYIAFALLNGFAVLVKDVGAIRKAVAPPKKRSGTTQQPTT